MSDILDRQQRGWLLPYLLGLDVADVDLTGLTKKDLKARNMTENAPLTYSGRGRWLYWFETIEAGRLLESGIPKIEFDSRPEHKDERAIQELLRYAVRRHYSWYPEAWLSFVRWLLHGFGRKGLEREIENIPVDLREQWYTEFNLANLLNSPCDWSAYALQGGFPDDKSTVSPWARSTGFYSTPMNVCTMMTEMMFFDIGETRTKSVCDPCCGTGSMLLPASNYSFLLYGMDIVYDLCLCAELNGWLWMPWLVYMPEETKLWLAPENKVGTEMAAGQQTLDLAEQRRESHRAFNVAVKEGKVTQGYLWGEQ